MRYSQFDNHETSPGFLLWQLASLWKHKIKETLTPFEMTHTQYVILTVTHYLHQNDMSVSQKMISDFSHIDVMTLSKTIRLLEKKGLVQRENDNKDTRAKIVALTAKGSELLKTVVPLVEEVDTVFFGIGVDNGIHQEALSLFSRVIAFNNSVQPDQV